MNVSWFTARGGLCLTAATAVITLTGCQTYQSVPLDLETHAQRWRELSPTNKEVREFADEIARSRADLATQFDPADGLSLSEAEIVALVFNPDLRIARSRIGIAEATVEHAGRWSDPTFNLNILKIAEAIPNPWYLSSSLSLTIPVSGRLKAEVSLAEASLGAEWARVAEVEWATRRNLRDAWATWSARQLQHDQTTAILDELDSVINTTSKLVEAGELPAVEASLFLLERESRRVERDQLAAGIAEDLQEIRGLLGLSPEAPVEFVPSIATTSREVVADSPDDRNPTLARLRSEYDQAERTLLTEVRKQYPDLAIGPQVEKDEGQSRIGFVGGIPIPILNANKQGIAEARAAREVARAAYETEYQRIPNRLAATRARLAGIQSRRTNLNSTLIPLVDRQVKDAYRLLSLGEGNSLVLLESLVRAYEVKSQLIDLQLENSRSDNEVHFLLGPETTPKSQSTNLD